jgi:hypothetical protein
MNKSVFEFLSESISEIKRLGSILCGDTLSGGDSWQKVAVTQAAELRWYATLLERIAAGKEGGGVVFPSWDEGGDGEWFAPLAEEIQGVPQPGVMPEWVAGQRLEDCETRLSVARETIRVMLHALESCRANIAAHGYGPLTTAEAVAACVEMAAAIASGERAMGST